MTEDFLRPNRAVIEANSPQAVAILQDLYRPLYLIETPFVITTLASAELIKQASNCFVALKISFIDELANLCEVLGLDVRVLAKAMGFEQRIGPKFLHAGPGFGGSFPKDTQALAQIAEQHGSSLRLVEILVTFNEQQKLRVVDKIAGALGALSSNGDSLKGKTIGLLGLAFKPNSDDVRARAIATWIIVPIHMMPESATVWFCLPNGSTFKISI